jgi:GAF domain-containing protein/HAMP domain-containing protein
MSETPKSILAARVTNIRARLIGSLLVTLVLLGVAAILYSSSLSHLDRSVAVLKETIIRSNTQTAEWQSAAFAEAEAARQTIRDVPLAWGFLIGIAVVGTTIIAIRSIAHPVEQLAESAARLAAGDMEGRVHFERADEFGRLGTAFNEMAERLQVYYRDLEQQVVERTRALQETNDALQRRAMQLEASAEIAQAITSIFDAKRLLSKTVDLIRDRFGFYHAGIFLLDETREWAILQEATGEAGARMKAQGHRLAVGDTSMVGWTAHHRQPRVALYAREDAVRFANPLLPHTRSEMTLPMIVGDQPLGVLNVQSTEEAAFDKYDVRVLQSMANQVAVALDNARRVADETRLLEATSPVYRASRRLAQASTVDEVADAITASVSETGADGCTIVEFQYSPEGTPQALLYLGVWRRDREPQFRRGMRLPISESPFPFEMVSTLWTVADVADIGDVDRASGGDQLLPQSARQVFIATGARALANIPLHARERVIGQVVVLRSSPGSFSDGALRLYEALSDQAAVALERARLLNETQRRADREQQTRQAVDRIHRAMDVQQALQTTVEELSRAMKVPHVSIELGLEAPTSNGTAAFPSTRDGAAALPFTRDGGT